ncbi:SDR family oxidoreductase [Cupriavidus necator]|uniref:SDR family NAD(P)-dependent oxidoreductase n=1 Tax=Cupriavidus necator TaxID=106590 RepID=UPI003ECC84E1
MEAKAMESKVVVVTGAGRGIGRDIALLMAEQGAKVVVNDAGVSVNGQASSETPADEVVALIRSRGGEAVASKESVAEWEGAQRIVGAALDSFGRIDVVVNNAGTLRDRIFHQMTLDDWDSVVKVNLSGSFYVSRAAAERFREQKSGSFVHMTSASGLVGNFGQASYAAAKLGVVALSKSIALDMSRYGVRSNCICPFAWSRMGMTIPDTPENAERLAKGRKMTPDKIAPLALFLASDAARDVTAQVFGVRMNEILLFNQPRPIRSVHRDGGWTQETLIEQMLPALKSSFMPLERSPDVFSWDPI